MRVWLMLMGALVVLGLALWLSSSSLKGPEPQQTTELEEPAEPATAPPQQSVAPADLSELLCPGMEEAPKPEPRRPTLTVMAACVEAQGRVMFVTKLPDIEDYLLKIWLTPRHAILQEACRAVATEELNNQDRYFAITIAKEDWPKFSEILQPGGPGNPYKLALVVVVQGVYVFSSETHRHLYGPHCEIHPLQKLELLEEPKQEDK